MKTTKTTKAKATAKKSAQSLPMKQTLNVVLHVRVPELQLTVLRHKGVDVPKLVRQAFNEAYESVTPTSR